MNLTQPLLSRANFSFSYLFLLSLGVGALVESFEEKFWYWQPIIILYKMLLVGGLSVVEQHSPIQLFAGFLICFAYLLIVLRASPYKDDDLDRLSFFTSLSMCLTLLFGLLKSMDEHRAERAHMEGSWEVPDGLFNAVLIFLNALPFIFAGLSTMLRWWSHRKEILEAMEDQLESVGILHDSDEDDDDATPLYLHTVRATITKEGTKEGKDNKTNGTSKKEKDGRNQNSVKVLPINTIQEVEMQELSQELQDLKSWKVPQRSVVITCTSRKQLGEIKKKYGPQSIEYKTALEELGKKRKTNTIKISKNKVIPTNAQEEKALSLREWGKNHHKFYM